MYSANRRHQLFLPQCYISSVLSLSSSSTNTKIQTTPRMKFQQRMISYSWWWTVHRRRYA